MEGPDSDGVSPEATGLTGPVAHAYRHLYEGRALSDVLQAGVDEARSIFGADMAWCALPDGDSLVGGAFSGWRTTDIAETFRVPLGEGVGGRVVKEGRTTIVRNYLHDPRRLQSLKWRIDEEGVRAGYVAPVPLDDPPGGVIYVAYRTARPLCEEEAALVTMYARDFGQVVQAALDRQAAGVRVATLEAELRAFQDHADLYARIADLFADADDLAGGLRLAGSALRAAVVLRDAFDHEILIVSHPDEGPGAPRPPVQGEVRLHGGLGRLQVLRPTSLSTPEARTVEQLAHLVALQLLRERTAAETEDRLRSHFLDDLLSGRLEDEEALFRQAALLGIDLRSPRAVACVGLHWAGFEPGPDENQPVLRWWVVDALQQATRARFRSVVSTVRDGAAVLLLESEDDDGAKLQEALSEILDAVERRTAIALSGGLGRTCAGVGEYARSSAEARTALSLARSRPKPSLVLRGGDLGVYGLLAQATNPDSLRAVVDATLGPLLNAKGKSQQEYFGTLALYLENDRNVERTATGLHIHVNTLRYRLHRIEELLGVDLREPDSRFLVELAVRVHQVLSRA